MFGFDNSQISEEVPEDTSRSQLQELNHLREMLPEPISRMNEYLIRQEVEEGEEEEENQELTANEEKMLLKINDQNYMILQLEEKLYYYRSECMRLIEENHQFREYEKQVEHTIAYKEKSLAETHQKLEEEYLKVSQLQKQIKTQQDRIKELSKSIEKGAERKQRQVSFRNTYNQELLSKQLLIQEKIILELTCKNEKLLRINGFLQVDLRQAEEKLISFEMDVQQKMCSLLVDNVSRLKENQNMISRNSHSYSLSQTHSNPKVNFSSNQPYTQENKTVKMQNSQDVRDEQQGRQFKTVEKDRILKPADYKYDYKLQPVESPKPQRKSNNRIQSFYSRNEPRQQRHRQSTKYIF